MIIYAPEAARDVERLHAWYAERSAAAADAFMRRLALAEYRIEVRPSAYRVLRDRQTRRYSFKINRAACLVDYIVEPAQIVILRVWHGRQNRPE